MPRRMLPRQRRDAPWQPGPPTACASTLWMQILTASCRRQGSRRTGSLQSMQASMQGRSPAGQCVFAHSRALRLALFGALPVAVLNQPPSHNTPVSLSRDPPASWPPACPTGVWASAGRARAPTSASSAPVRLSPGCPPSALPLEKSPQLPRVCILATQLDPPTSSHAQPALLCLATLL